MSPGTWTGDDLAVDGLSALERKRVDNLEEAMVGVPAYNEEDTIASVVMKVQDHVDNVVVVDDGSNDDTARLAEKAGAHVIEHERNMGKGEAMKTLFQYARQKDASALVTLDGDGQHPEHEITNLLDNVLSEEHDIAIGSRFLEEDHKNQVPAYRRLGNWMLSVVTPTGKAKNGENGERGSVKDTQSGFRAYSSEAIRKITPNEKSLGVDSEILIQARKYDLDIVEMPATVSYDGKTSHEGPIRHTLSVMGSIVRYIETRHSLLTFGLPGLIAFFLGLIIGVRALTWWNRTGVWPVGHVLIGGLLVIGGMAMGITGLILHAIINAHRRDYR